MWNASWTLSDDPAPPPYLRPMRAFADLIDRLTLTPSRNGKLTLMVDYFRARPDPERGWALAAITRDLDVPNVKANTVKTLALERVDEILFRYSYDFVGDLAETVALVWPERPTGEDAPELPEVVDTLLTVSRAEAPRRVEDWLDALDGSGRYAMLKLVTGAMRIGVSARLAKQALAQMGGVDVNEIEELWHGLGAPYEELFAWLEGSAPKPANAALAPFRPVMLATPAEDGATDAIDLADYAAEWKWDGIRVQATSEGGVRRLYSRTGDDISGAFPDVVDAMAFEGSVDGELLVGRLAPGADVTGGSHEIEVGTFSDLQQRLNRKTVSEKVRQAHPAFVRLYDILQDGGENTRPLPFRERRERLERFAKGLDPHRFDVSPLVEHGGWDHAKALRNDPPHPIIEGLMFKRWDSDYVPGRPRGPWLKWKRDPFLVDAVMLYAQRGHGKRSSFYSDYTFGVWDEEERLIPVGKAYSGFTDAELRKLDKYVRDHTVERFGPVRSVRADKESGLVLEIAFEGLQKSTRHKSGVAMRFPRVNRIRWDKPAAEADRIETMRAMLALAEAGEHMGGAVRTGPRPSE